MRRREETTKTTDYSGVEWFLPSPTVVCSLLLLPATFVAALQWCARGKGRVRGKTPLQPGDEAVGDLRVVKASYLGVDVVE